ncbi:lipopolysaccharide biosynthesis protein [Jeotgalibaca ciconiae]|uniref:Lipopolysaccharide biosynthesis protein n=1 Tax=Jeotgalibaca ciconiae TaxID=2496265 RepID=A0A3S9HC06_9LACT|nr:oligosaccharide flippase family protein [Jeotgalibaca ciconiae]AZP04909.1 lipopolysaccharide biosynthesis protein [Jeotgalibaca ciconiae]
MNRYNKLIGNSLIFTIGSFGSKIISFIMVPFYTHLLSAEEYGIVDLIITTISFLIPLTTLELGQAALRFGIDIKSEDENSNVFSNISMYGIVVSLTILILGLLGISIYQPKNNLLLLFLILLIFSIFNTLYSQYIRGIGLIKQFALNGILMTLITVSSNIIFIVILKYKIEGYILSLIFSNVFSTLYLFYSAEGIKKVKKFAPDQKLMKKMLKFSIPIIPDTAMWWIITGSARYFILIFIGSAANGIYAVASKIPSIISLVTGIFSQAWQISYFEEYGSEDKDTFYSKVFNVYSMALFTIGSATIVVIKPLIKFLVEESFYESWKITPLLVVAVIYQSLSNFIGTNYTASKETKGTLITSVTAGGVSLITSIIFVPIFGMIGAGLSSVVCFFFMFIIRLKDTKRFVDIKINKTQFVLNNFIYGIQIIVLFYNEGVSLFIIELLLFLCLLLINQKNIKLILKIVTGKRNRILS